MTRYTIFFKPTKQHIIKRICLEWKTSWQFVNRYFTSVRSAKRYAKINKIYCYGIYKCGVNKINDDVFHTGY